MGSIYQKYKTINIGISIITIIISLFCKKEAGYEHIYIIPITYLVLYSFCNNFHYYSERYIGLFMLNILSFIKYIISILIICISKNYSLEKYYVISVSETSYFQAIIFISVEILTIFIAVQLLSPSIYKSENGNKLSYEYNDIYFGPIIAGFFLLCVALIALQSREYFSFIDILLGKKNSLTDDIDVQNSTRLIFRAFNPLFFGFLINKCITAYRQSEKLIYVIASYLFIVLFSLTSVSSSRVNFIIPIILFILLTREIFKKYNLSLNLFSAFILSGLFAIVSAYKNPWKYDNNNSMIDSLNEFSKSIQEYTSNILPTAIGIQSIERYSNSITFKTLLNDLFGSIPIIAKFVDQSDRINYYYNNYALGGSSTSQIIPLSVSSSAYFTPIFSGLFVFICVILLMYIDNDNKNKAKNYVHAYMNLYLTFIFAFCIGSNLQMIVGRIFTIYLPAKIILYLNDKISLNRKL